jgi:tRNA threonylcarbamoyladenosine biosynthesis protein TsaB
MIILLDTSTPVCHLTLYDGEKKVLDDSWRADRELAEKLFEYLEEKLQIYNKSIKTITGIGIFKGPGSFTGLRIGVAVCNVIANDRGIPIVGTTGDNWREAAFKKLKNAENDKVVIPEYGREARITTQRK